MKFTNSEASLNTLNYFREILTSQNRFKGFDDADFANPNNTLHKYGPDWTPLKYFKKNHTTYKKLLYAYLLLIGPPKIRDKYDPEYEFFHARRDDEPLQNTLAFLRQKGASAPLHVVDLMLSYVYSDSDEEDFATERILMKEKIKLLELDCEKCKSEVASLKTMLIKQHKNMPDDIAHHLHGFMSNKSLKSTPVKTLRAETNKNLKIKLPRCKNGTRRNKKTSLCEPK